MDDVAEVRDYAVRIAYRSGRRVDHEDIAQEVAERFLRQHPRPDNARAWTRTVTRHLVIDAVRASGVRTKWHVDERPWADDDQGVTLDDLGQAVYGPSAGIADRSLILEVLGTLSMGDLTVLLERADGRSHEEIAERHGYASGQVVATKVHRARQRLRERFPDADLLFNAQRTYDLRGRAH